ncbi:VWA domain-containing protein [Streptomyces sp. NPDC002825]|uniref:VWA domain-containing protein n=1 Tax=Streptomyces sp. NPDC002825 TaxID=3154666 RepID=UPI00332C25D4
MREKMQWNTKGSALLLAGALLALSGPLGAPTASGAAMAGAAGVPRTGLTAAGTPGSLRTALASAAGTPGSLRTALASAAGAGGTARTVADPAEGPDPLDFAVVVDQSASLAEKDLARETEAAALLSQGEISERSRATVIGFGSSEKPGQSPVRDVCPLTVADAAGRETLSRCVQELGRRDAARMGPGTDFPAAIRQAVTRLTEAASGTAKKPAVPKVVFLLTDGKLDVADSPEYGTDRDTRQSNGARRLTEELARARAAGVQIWPLGFGSEIDRSALTAMAEGGYRGACSDIPGSVPRMRVVGTSAGIDRALQETFAAARCARIAEGTVGKPPADLTVVIPPIATDGSLTVAKHDPKVRVTYFDPAGRKVPVRGEFDGSTFEVSGQDGPVEALRVKDPLPGRWRVHIEAPEGHRDREVAVRAIWQGRLRSDVTLDPASPRAGEKVTVQVRMQTRRGVVITDPKQLAGLTASAEVSGAGFAPFTFKLADDGRAPDAKAGDVRFTGTFTLPTGATGDLELVTRMAAPGITSDRRPVHARRGPDVPVLTAGLLVDRATVHPGGTVRGTLDVTNNDSAPHTLRLALQDQTPGTELTLAPTPVTAPAGKSTRIPFTVTLAPGTALGELGGQVAVVDTGDGDAVLDTAFLDVLVVAPPTWWDRWWKAVTGGAALVLVLAVLTGIRLIARSRRRDLTGVRLELFDDDRSLFVLKIRKGQSQNGTFAFTVDEPYGGSPMLRPVRGSAASTAHVLRRNGSGEMLLRPRGAGQVPVRPGEPIGLGEYELVVQGGRVPTPRRTRTPRRPGPGTGRPGTGRGDTGPGTDPGTDFGDGLGTDLGTGPGAGSGAGPGSSSGAPGSGGSDTYDVNF